MKIVVILKKIIHMKMKITHKITIGKKKVFKIKLNSKIKRNLNNNYFKLN